MNESSLRHPGPQPRLRERVKEATRNAILEGAESLFSEEGIDRPRMEEIAARSGVAVGTLYNYFSDRESLVTALLEEHRLALVTKLDHIVEQNARRPFDQQLRAFVEASLLHFDEHRQLYLLLFEEELFARRFGSKRVCMREMYLLAEKITEVGLAKGVLRRELKDLYATLLVGMLRGIFVRALFRKDEPVSGCLDSLLSFFMQGGSVR